VMTGYSLVLTNRCIFAQFQMCFAKAKKIDAVQFNHNCVNFWPSPCSRPNSRLEPIPNATPAARITNIRARRCLPPQLGAALLDKRRCSYVSKFERPYTWYTHGKLNTRYSCHPRWLRQPADSHRNQIRIPVIVGV